MFGLELKFKFSENLWKGYNQVRSLLLLNSRLVLNFFSFNETEKIGNEIHQTAFQQRLSITEKLNRSPGGKAGYDAWKQAEHLACGPSSLYTD